MGILNNKRCKTKFSNFQIHKLIYLYILSIKYE